MRIIKENKDYKIPAWITTCRDCESEFEFTLKDTHIIKYGGSVADRKEYWIQCPVCGRWIHVLINHN